MENRTSQNKRTTYTSRFANPAGGSPQHTATAARSRAAGAQTGARPSGFAPAAPRKSSTAAAKPEPKNARQKSTLDRSNNKRGAKRPAAPGWLKFVIIGAVLLVILIIVLALAFGGKDVTYHQLPRVERGSSSAFSPEETSAPDGAPSSPAEAPQADVEAALDESDVWNADAFLGGADVPEGFGSVDDAALADIAGAFGAAGDWNFGGTDAANGFDGQDEQALLDELMGLIEAGT